MSSERDEAADRTNQLLFLPSDEIVNQITSLGFSKNAALRALYNTGNQTPEQAINWLLENSDQDLDTPLELRLSEDSDEEEFDQEHHKMVFVVNCELNMGVGKVAAQVAHAALALFRSMMEDDVKAATLLIWEQVGEKKIVLKGENTKQLQSLAEQASELQLDNYIVHDAGHTQVPAGSATVLAIFGAVSTVDQVTSKLKLL